MREFLIQADKNFRVSIPDDAKVTFGPWSPPKKGEYRQDGDRQGTLRIYQGTKDNIIACFSGVRSFRDLSLNYAEEVVREEASIVWKTDGGEYIRETHSSQTKEWVEPKKQLDSPKEPKTAKKTGSKK